MATNIPLYYINDEGNSTAVSETPVPSQTPVRSITKKASVLQPLVNSDSSNGSNNNDLKPGYQSDPRKSFLYLNNDSSPSVPGDSPIANSTTSHSDSPTARSMQHRTHKYTPPSGLSRGATAQGTKARYEAESSFFNMTSPLASRNDKSDTTSRYRNDNDDLDQPTSRDSISRRNTRGTGLGAQMGRTSSAQSAQSINSNDRYMSPESPAADTSIDSILSRRPTPTRRAHGKRIENAIEKLMLTSQKSGFDSSPSDRHALKTSLKRSQSNVQVKDQHSLNQIDPSKSKIIDFASSPNADQLARLHPESQAVEIQSQAIDGEKADAVESEKLLLSPQLTSTADVPINSQARAKKVGRLSRLQYNKSDAVMMSSRPAWDSSETAAASSRISPVNRSAPRLHGQASNPSLLSEYKRADRSPSADKSDLETQRSSSVAESRDYQESSSVLPSSPRSGERRELLLPALNGMRIAVENAVTSPTESFIRGIRRRSSAALLQQKTEREGMTNSNVEVIESQYQTQANQAVEKVVPIDVPLGWQAESRQPDASQYSSPIQPTLKQKAVPKVNIMSSSSSPQAPTSCSRMVLPKKAPSKSIRGGKLSDEEIVQLGATAGVDPSTLLNSNGQALSSKNILTIALQKAQSAVSLDGENKVGEAISAYHQAVRLLEEVMDRVNPSNSSSSRRKSSREEERRRLKVIHDTYADRIRLLSIIYQPEDTLAHESSGEIAEDIASREASTSVLVEVPADQNSTALQFELRGGVPLVVEVTKAQSKEKDLRDEDGKEEALMPLSRLTAVDKSDSDHSFQSAMERSGRKGDHSATLQAPPSHARLASGTLSADGGEEAQIPPTPYFDVDQDFHGDHLNPSGAQSRAASKRSPSLSERMLIGQRKKSRSPIDRLARGMSSLNNVPSARDIAATERATHHQKSRRFLSVGSRALLEKELSSGRSSTSSQRDDASLRAETPPYTDVTSSTPAAKGPLTSATIIQRPRATTSSVAETNRRLVSNDVAGGTINQRRRLAADDNLLTNSSGDEGRTIDANEYTSRAFSPSRVSNEKEMLRERHMVSRTSPISGTLLSDDEGDTRDSNQRFSLGRKRASSQPGNRRPSIPLNFLQHSSGSTNGPPPVPQIRRKASMPLSPLAIGSNRNQVGVSKSPASILGNSFASLRFPSPAMPMSPGYHALGTPLTPLQHPWPGMTLGSYSNEGKSSLIADIFGSALPSMQVGAIPSFTSNSYAISLPWLGINHNLPDPKSTPQAPRIKSLRPFYTMRQLQSSIEKGAYISKRLYVPRDLWLQSGSRLLAIETKIRVIDSVISGIDGIEQSGRFLLHPMQFDQPGLTAIDASKFLKLLEDFDLLLVEVQNTLAKKLGFLETVRGKKGGGLGVLGSKLTRSLDRMTHNSKSIDSPATYVDGLHRLFIRSQVLGDHIGTLERSKNDRGVSSPIRGDFDGQYFNTDNYATLPSELKRNIEIKLNRCSEFFANVVVRFVLRDVAILLDKSVKRNSLLLTE